MMQNRYMWTVPTKDVDIYR